MRRPGFPWCSVKDRGIEANKGADRKGSTDRFPSGDFEATGHQSSRPNAALVMTNEVPRHSEEERYSKMLILEFHQFRCLQDRFAVLLLV